MCAEPVFTGMSPVAGAPGTVVTLTGSDFDPMAGYGVTIDGTPAAVGEVSANLIRFTVAPGTGTGAVRLVAGSETIETGHSFAMRRNLAGSLQLPRKVNPTGYLIMAGGLVVEPDAQGGFTAPVLLDRASIVMAFREPEDPVFLGVAHSGLQTMEIDRFSTACAQVFLVPFLGSRDDERAQATLGVIAARDETAVVAGLIDSISRDGGDYLNDSRFRSALKDAVTAALSQPQAAKAYLGGANLSTLVKEINPAAETSKLQLDHLLTKPKDNHPDHFVLSITNRNRFNPVDWVMEIYQAPASAFPGGRSQINMLDHTAMPEFVDGTAGASGFLRANLLTAKLDLVEVAANALVDGVMSLTGLGPEFASHQFLLERDEPAVYVAQSYSGNIWYGTSLLPEGENQAALLEAVDKNGGWSRALAANVVIASVDLASLLLDLSEVIGDEDFIQTLLATLFVDVSKALAIYNHDPDGLTAAAVIDIAKNAAAAVIKAAINNFAEDGIVAFIKKAGKATLKLVASTVDILGKVSALGQVLERTAGFATPRVLAIERAVVVVGSPFEPRIRSFAPRTGRAGTLVHISGYNFPPKNEVTVSFCTFTRSITDEDELETVPLTATLPAEVLESAETSILIRVPEGWEQTFNTSDAYICIENLAGDHTRTTVLDDPYRFFTHIPSPKLLEVTPNPTYAEGLITLIGENFDGAGRLINEVLLDGSTSLTVVNASDTHITARLPLGIQAGQHTVQVRWRDQLSEAVGFTVEDPVSEANGYSGGLRITITKADWSNTPDGEISVLEALLLANGTLGRPIEQHPPDDDRTRETDWVAGDNSGLVGGPTQKDVITTSQSLKGQVVACTSPVPPISSGDNINLGYVILDGSGAGGGAAGLVLDGVVESYVERVTLRNFGGHGVHLLNGARGNLLDYIRIENCGGDGLFLDSQATQNSVLGFKVSGAGGVGIHLSGNMVRYNDLSLDAVSTDNILGLAENCSSHGVLLEAGAAFNAVHPGTVRNNGGHGILVTGATTDHNVIGRNSDVRPRLGDVYNNQGHGVYLTAGVEHTVVRWINPAGNTGDGIRLEGPDCAYNQCDSVFTGIDYFDTPYSAIELANGGNGIHLLNGAHHNLLGSRTPGGFGERSSIANNQGAGILIDGEGSSHNTICRMNIGDIESSFLCGWHPNGTHGIHLRNGTHDNTLGDRHSWLDLHISGQPAGAGILLEGSGTDNNRILGNQIGSDHGNNSYPSEGLLNIGIHIRDGARFNTVGYMGGYIEISEPPNYGDYYRPFNVIGNATRAGILLEGCSDNIIQNNYIGVDESGQNAGNRLGIELTGGAANNRIGGPIREQGNRINLNDDAGIALIDNPLDDIALSNPILNNEIHASGAGAGSQTVVDPLTGVSYGVGILIQGTTANNRVGEAFSMRNDLEGNRVGVYIDAANDNLVQSLEIRESGIAGVIIRSGMRNRLGGDVAEGRNVITGNGGGDPEEGGVLIAEGGANLAQLNYIGTRGGGDAQGGNNGVGILIKNSPDNLIGGDRLLMGNVIGSSSLHGIRISGAASSGNIVRNNLVGQGRGGANLGNGGNGILLDAGASDNQIGGRYVMRSGRRLIRRPMGNQISHNTLNGVEVNGSGSAGNSILDNSITANTLAGIALTGGGNGDIPPPLQALYDGDSFTGTVPSLMEIPVGSLVQLFCDGDPNNPEGDLLLGEATVLTGGQWFIPHIGIPVFPTLSMTATHAATGATSPFGIDVDFDLGFKTTRANNTAPGARFVVVGQGDLPVLLLEVGAVNADADVLGMTFDAEGDLDEGTQVTAARVYLDADEDGRVGSGDTLLAGPQTFDQDNGSVSFAFETARVHANTTQQWILAYDTLPTVPQGTAFSVKLTDAQSVDADYAFPGVLKAAPGNPFPVVSDMLTVGLGLTLEAWKQQHFTSEELANEQISGNGADPDGDGVINVVEYALGLDPKVSDRSGLPASSIVDGKLIVTYTRARNLTDVAFGLKASVDLPTLIESAGLIDVFSIKDNEDGTETVTLESVRNVADDPRLFVILQILFGQS